MSTQTSGQSHGFVIRRYKDGKPIVNHLTAICHVNRIDAEMELARIRKVFPLGDFRLEAVDVSPDDPKWIVDGKRLASKDGGNQGL